MLHMSEEGNLMLHMSDGEEPNVTYMLEGGDHNATYV